MTTIILCLGIPAGLGLLLIVYSICRVSGMCSEAEERRDREWRINTDDC